MKWLNFFIDRPVTATVVNLMLVICGVLAFRGLTVDEYPRIVVPKLIVSTYYQNASAQVVEKEITAPIEEALAMIEGIESISSTSSSESSEVFLKFSPNISMDRAAMQTNEELARIARKLPKDADAPKVNRAGDNRDKVFWLSVKSKTLKGANLTHFASVHVKNHFQGIDGLAQVEVLGPPFAMEIELDQVAMVNQRVGLPQIIQVLKANELLLQAGRIRHGDPISLDVVAKSAADYQRMIVGQNGGVPVFLGDVANVRLEEDERAFNIKIDGHNSVLIGIVKTSDGNILDVTNAIHAVIPKVNEDIRGTAVVSIESDKSVFVRESLKTIYRTIAEACVLVLLIIFLFLRHVRATLVPLVTIPISLIATFFALKIFGLTINTITLLALVLSVGLVVDDAIVVLENIFRYREEGMDALAAAKKGAQDIGFAIIAMTATLVSVFLPLAFVQDITGVLLREFAITLASAVLFSGIVALTLSPLMCATLLKKAPKENRLSQAIENAIKKVELLYKNSLHAIFNKRLVVYGVLVAFLAAGIFVYRGLNSDLVPKEDRGIIGASIPRIPGYSLDDMEFYADQAEAVFLNHPDVERTLSLSFEHNNVIVAILKPWQVRHRHSEKILEDVTAGVAHIATANIYPWSWNIGLEALQDDQGENAEIAISLKSPKSYEELDAVAQALVAQMRQSSVVKDARSDLNLNERTLSLNLLREPMAALGIDEKAVSLSVQAFSDRMTPSEFKLDEQRYRVYLKPKHAIWDLTAIYVPSKLGEQVPVSAIATVSQEIKAPSLKHRNQMRSATVFASLAAGKNLSDAKKYLDDAVQKIVPADISVSYEGVMAMEKKTSQTFFLLFIAGLIFIFAILAIQFEAVLDPLIILVTVPLACIGGVLMLWVCKSGTNLYTQVGMLTLIGLITKHGILLTEFVAHHRRKGEDLKAAIMLAAKLRFRPIIMTTAATVLGALPLITTSGAGVEARAAIGMVIVGGMTFGTILTLFVLPLIIFSAHTMKDRVLQK